MKKNFFWLMILLLAAVMLGGCKKADEDNIRENEVITTAGEEENQEKEEPTNDIDAENNADNDETIEVSLEEAETAFDLIAEDLEYYAFVLIYLDNDDMYHSDTDEVVINLDEREITRASALSNSNSVDYSYYMNEESDGSYSLSDYEDGGELLVEEISKETLNKSSKNLFGKEADIKSLEIFSPDSSLYDVVRINEDDEFASRLFSQYENEGALEYMDSKVTVQNGTAICVKDLYCGYWGYARFEKSNYRITMELEKNDESYYGFIIKSIKYRRTDNETDWSYEDIDEDAPLSLGERSDNYPFWGVFVFASKDMDEAVKCANEVNNKGFDADYLDTPSWSELNKELWFVVTAGKYDSKEAAEEALTDVKAAGYGNAYVKYTGEYSLNQY